MWHGFLPGWRLQHLAGNDPLQLVKTLGLVSGERRVACAVLQGLVGKPLMAPHPRASADDDGWLPELAWNEDREGSDLVIHVAVDLRDLALFELPLATLHGLHVNWVNASSVRLNSWCLTQRLI